MKYSSESNNKRCGLSAGFFALTLLITVVLAGTAGAPTSAFAANIDCGQCHGTFDNGTNAVTNNPTDRRGVTVPGYESSTMPQPDNGKTSRGLHGIHMNYSSATYGNRGTQLVNGVSYPRRGNCSYCHNGHPQHATGFVNFTAAAAITPVATQPLLGNKYLMVYTSAGRGVSYKNNIPSMDDNAYGNCTVACHKGTTQANPAPWGNYTAAAVRLSCNSCHADINGATGTEPALSGAHAAHLSSAAVVPSFVYMNSANNAGCVNCHTDNTSEGKTVTDTGTMVGGSGKAYPHASDGTNVVSDNVTLTNNITGSTRAGTNTTCTAACHPRSNLITPAVKWGDTVNCNMCHYYESTPTSAGNNAVPTGSLPGAHNLHLDGGLTCANCHNVPSGTTHATIMPPSSAGVTFGGDAGSGTVNVNGGSATCVNFCHQSISGDWSSTTTATKSCKGCHDQIINTNSTDAALGTTLRNISSDFANGSHHIVGSWYSISPADCAACHMEGDTATGNTTSYHMNGTIDLKQWNGTFNASSVTAVAYTPTSSSSTLTPFCEGCHSQVNNGVAIFSDGKAPNVYAWDSNSIASKYSNISTTPWGKFNSATYNVVPADKVTKAFSPHGQPGKNDMTMSIASFSIYSGTKAVQCYDCHNAHASNVAGGTSYTSGNNEGGIIKTTSTYVPRAGGSATDKNTYSSSSSLCFDCHLGDNAAAPKKYTDYGLPTGKTVAGSYYDRVGNTKVWNNWSTTRWSTNDVWRGSFAYKDANFAGGHFGNSMGYMSEGLSSMGTKVNGNCTACHDPHGVSPAIKRGVTKPVRTVNKGGTGNGPVVTGAYTGGAGTTRVYVVQMTSTTVFRVFNDGGKTALGTTGTVGGTGVTDNGLTINIPSGGTYAIDDTWTFIAGPNPNFMVPALKGTWMHSPYKEDRAPRSSYTTDLGPKTATTARLTGITNADDYTGAANPTSMPTRLWDDQAGGTTPVGSTREVGGPAPRANPDFNSTAYVMGYNTVAVQGDGFGQGPNLANLYGTTYANNTLYKGWNGFFIDENTFGATKSYWSAGAITTTRMTGANAAATPANFAGLCLQCHAWQKSSGIALNNITSSTLGVTGKTNTRLLTKPHETVSGLGTITVDLFRRENNYNNGTWAAGARSQQHVSYGHNMVNYTYGPDGSNDARQGPAGQVSVGTGSYGVADTTANSTGNGTSSHYYRWGPNPSTVSPGQGALGAIDASYHQFPCSKCHTPHVSRLQRLMKTNCLDNDDLTKAGATGGAHTTMPYVTKTAGSATANDYNGALWRNNACHSTKIQATDTTGTGTWAAGGGWNNKTPW